MVNSCLLFVDCHDKMCNGIIQDLLRLEGKPSKKDLSNGFSTHSLDLETKYYTADINLCFLENLTKLEQTTNTLKGKIEGILLTFDPENEQNFERVKIIYSAVDEDLPFKLLVCSSLKHKAHKYSVLEWCIDNHFELVELEVDDEEEDDEEDEEILKEKKGVERIMETIKCNQWSNLVLKEKPRNKKLPTKDHGDGVSKRINDEVENTENSNNNDTSNNNNINNNNTNNINNINISKNVSEKDITPEEKAAGMGRSNDDMNVSTNNKKEQNTTNNTTDNKTSNGYNTSNSNNNTSNNNIGDNKKTSSKNNTSNNTSDKNTTVSNNHSSDSNNANNTSNNTNNSANNTNKNTSNNSNKCSGGVAGRDTKAADDDELENLFKNIPTFKEKACQLGFEERKKYAEKVVMQFWSAIGGDIDELED